MKPQTVRLLANAILTVFSMLLIISKLAGLATFDYRWLWGVPALLVAGLNLYFLTQSYFTKPKEMDTSLSSFLISVGASLGFCFSGLFITYPVPDFPGIEVIRQIGSVVSLLPYPFVIWALLCLGKCLTVIPEAHTVVAHGIYKYSRHPLYVCYIVWEAANILMFPSLPVIAGASLHIGLLLARMRREEKLLLASFPEYRIYYSTTGLVGRRTVFDPSLKLGAPDLV